MSAARLGNENDRCKREQLIWCRLVDTRTNVLYLLLSRARATFSSFCLRVRQDDIGCSRSSNGHVGNLDAARGEFAAVTDGEINRPDNRARCTRRRKETNEQTHNHRRVIYTNHLDAIMTARSRRIAKLLTQVSQHRVRHDPLLLPILTNVKFPFLFYRKNYQITVCRIIF